MPPHEAYSRARAAANKALEIDPELGEVYASLGWIAMWYDWDWPAAERFFLKAIQKKPDYATAHLWYGLCLSILGRFGESLREIQEARRMEPLETVNAAVLGWALYMARRFDESIKELRKVIELDPEFSIAYWYQSGNFIAQKMWGEAIPTIQKLVELSSESIFALSALGLAYALSGMKAEALKILERMDGLSKDRYVGSLWRAMVWMGLGEMNRALENLEKAYLEKESIMACLKIWPMLDSLRPEPRFKDLLKKMNLDK
jgi:tetratricopeptide (TPR) repeat protein